MPAGIPVGTLAIGRAGAVNAALLATAMLGDKYPADPRDARRFRDEQTPEGARQPRPAGGGMKVGVLGGGQLGRMLALAGYPLGLRFRFLDPAPEAPVEELAELRRRRLRRPRRAGALPRRPGRRSPTSSRTCPSRRPAIWPRPGAGLPAAAARWRSSQDRLAEKTLFATLGMPPRRRSPPSNLRRLDEAVARSACPRC